MTAFAAPLGLENVDHVYVRFDSPASSPPSTLTATGAATPAFAGVADAGVTTVGGWSGATARLKLSNRPRPLVPAESTWNRSTCVPALSTTLAPTFCHAP